MDERFDEKYLNATFDLTPEQYHAGVDKLWKALRLTDVQKQDVFTLASDEIDRLRQLVNDVASGRIKLLYGWDHDNGRMGYWLIERKSLSQQLQELMNPIDNRFVGIQIRGPSYSTPIDAIEAAEKD